MSVRTPSSPCKRRKDGEREAGPVGDPINRQAGSKPGSFLHTGRAPGTTQAPGNKKTKSQETTSDITPPCASRQSNMNINFSGIMRYG